SSTYHAPKSERQFMFVGEGSKRKVATVPCKNVVRLVKVAWPYWLSAMFSFDWKGCTHAPKEKRWRPRVHEILSSKVKRLRWMERLLPLLLPARPTCACGFEAALPPTTTAPTGCPNRKPGTFSAGVPGVGKPVKKYPARENPKRAVFRRLEEKT